MTTVEPTSPPTAVDVMNSINGYDEIAIAQAFGLELSTMLDEDRPMPMRFLRAMIFIAERRGGAKDSAAYKTAMSLTSADAGTYFPDPPDDPAEEVDGQGKAVEPSTS